MMRFLGWTGSLLLMMALAGCGSANSLEDPGEESGTYVAPPKIEFAKRKAGSKASASKSTAPATSTASGTTAK